MNESKHNVSLHREAPTRNNQMYLPHVSVDSQNEPANEISIETVDAEIFRQRRTMTTRMTAIVTGLWGPTKVHDVPVPAPASDWSLDDDEWTTFLGFSGRFESWVFAITRDESRKLRRK